MSQSERYIDKSGTIYVDGSSNDYAMESRGGETVIDVTDGTEISHKPIEPNAVVGYSSSMDINHVIARHEGDSRHVNVTMTETLSGGLDLYIYSERGSHSFSFPKIAVLEHMIAVLKKTNPDRVDSTESEVLS